MAHKAKSESFIASNGIMIDDNFWERTKGRLFTEEEVVAIRQWKNKVNVEALLKVCPPTNKS